LGNPAEAEDLLKEATAWGEGLEDARSFNAFLKLSGSRLDARRQDLFRARQRAQEAFELYKELESPIQQAEAAAQLALVEFNDGNFNASLSKVNEADALTEAVPLRGLTSFIRGLIAQREKKNDDALQHFSTANQMAGQSGRGALALDAGMKMGEVLLNTGKTAQAAEVLNQVQQIAQGLKAAAQERTICAMAAQALASQQNIAAALEKAQRALQISHAMQDRRALPADLYNVGLFQLMSQKPSEAVALLKQARQIADTNNIGLMKEILFHLGMGQDQMGEKSAAEEALISALKPVQEARDVNKAMAIYEKLAEIANGKGDKSRAEQMLNNALNVAKQLQNKDLQKRFKERLKNL
jgi:tetratricopeptide (TPR) repeat protein